MTMWLRRHYKGHRNERLKRKALRRLRTTDVHVWCGMRMWRVAADCSKYGQQQQGIANGGQPCTTDIQRQWGRGSVWFPESVVYSSSSARYGKMNPTVHTRCVGWVRTPLTQKYIHTFLYLISELLGSVRKTCSSSIVLDRKISTTRCQILRQKMHQIRFPLGLRPVPRRGSLQRSLGPSCI